MPRRSPPIDVFVSYKREDRDTAKALAEALALRGYSVWWDVDLLPGDRFADEIMAVIKRAKATIVLWSHASVASSFVRAEASVAAGLERLIPARLDDCELPLPFNVLHTHDLTGWHPGADETLLVPLFNALEARTGKAPTAPQQPAESADNLHRQDEEADLWRSISEQSEPSIEEYTFYLQKYPDGTFADLANLRLAKLKKRRPLKWLNKRVLALGALATAIAAIIGVVPTVSEDLPSLRQIVTEVVTSLTGKGDDKTKPEPAAEADKPTPDAPATTTAVEPAAGPATADRDRQPGDVFNDCDDEGWCPAMVVVPAGSFMMGSTEDEEGHYSDEYPPHRVTIAEAFAIGVYEVTRGQFATFVEATGHDAGDRCWTYEDGSWDWRDGKSWRSPGFAQSDDHPVVCVSWDDAQAYVDWLNAELGLEDLYRLPSEAEWEYAARAGTDKRYWPGDDITPEYANFGMNVGKTIEVGSLGRPNDFGLHDVHGNVWEWVADCWNDSYAGAPDDGTAWTTGDCGRLVLRCGSWYVNPRYLRSAYRSRNEPGNRNGNFGFRVARTLR